MNPPKFKCDSIYTYVQGCEQTFVSTIITTLQNWGCLSSSVLQKKYLWMLCKCWKQIIECRLPLLFYQLFFKKNNLWFFFDRWLKITHLVNDKWNKSINGRNGEIIDTSHTIKRKRKNMSLALLQIEEWKQTCAWYGCIHDPSTRDHYNNKKQIIYLKQILFIRLTQII